MIQFHNNRKTAKLSFRKINKLADLIFKLRGNYWDKYKNPKFRKGYYLYTIGDSK